MVRNPFTTKVDDVPARFQEALIDLKNDGLCQDYFQTEDLETFWVKRTGSHPLLREEAIKYLTVLASTYLCEQGFSSLIYTKNKYRSKLNNIEDDLRLAIAKIPPRVALLVRKMQAQPSH